MLYELRTYEVVPGCMKAVVDRFANITLKYFSKHGIRPVVFMEPVIGTSNQLVYILEWESMAEREQKWGAFQSDSQWIAARAETERGGPLVARIDNRMLAEVGSIMSVLRASGGAK